MTNVDQQVLQAANAAVGLAPDAGFELVSARRGQAVWTVTDGDQRYKVKLALDAGDGIPPANGAVEREGYALADIAAYRERFQPVSAAVEADGSTLACLRTAWVDGAPSFAHLDPNALPSNADLLALVRQTCLALQPLHAAGWAHGDLQPVHFVTTSSGVTLLDLALAQRPADPLPDYKGGMVHFSAPEICAAVVGDTTPVATLASDVYGFGAVVSFALTRRVVGGYEMDLSWEDMLAWLAQGKQDLTPLEALRDHAPDAVDLIAMCVAPNAADRPASAMAVLDEIGRIQDRGVAR